MTPHEQLVASQYWFAWDDPTARKALLAAVMSRFLPAAEMVLDRNRQTGRCPTSWASFVELRRHPRNIERTVRGDYNTTLEFLVGAAAILQLNVREFFPDTVEWVALATYYVVTTQRRVELEARGYAPTEAFEIVRQAPDTVTLDHARLYARTLLDRPACPDRGVSAEQLRTRWTTLPAEHREHIHRVIAHLATVVVESDRSRMKRETAR